MALLRPLEFQMLRKVAQAVYVAIYIWLAAHLVPSLGLKEYPDNHDKLKGLRNKHQQEQTSKL